MRICIVYDCLYPYTVGGAERWYRNLAERLAADGHEVTYLTMRQWDGEPGAGPAGVGVRAVSPGARLYTRSGRRRILPPLAFGAGVLLHLLRRGRRYDVVHTASFPYFSVLAAAAARRRARYALVIDWHEVWTRDYWREYLGRAGGALGWWVQLRCVRVRQRAICFSRLHAERLRRARVGGEVTRLEGQYAGQAPAARRLDGARPVVVFAGRHIPEKRVTALPRAIALARRELPELRCEIYGDGPDRDAVAARVRELGLDDAIALPGFVAAEEVERALADALCMALPSRREGYGLVVLEAAARGTPSVVVADPDNAAVDLVSDGESGVVAPAASPEALAAAIVRVRDAGPALRRSTAAWFDANADRLSLSASLERVSGLYR
jgi:glycosyltransferase involved in cell wall biosynthesis